MPPTHDDQPRILVMDANERNADLLSDFLTEEGYEPTAVTDLDAADDIVADASRFAFAIIDIDRFEDPVWPYCEQLHENSVPFIILSGLQASSLQRESQEYGARSFVNKPVPKQELRGLIHTAIDP